MNEDKMDSLDSYASKLLEQMERDNPRISKRAKLLTCQKMMDMCFREMTVHRQDADREEIQKDVIARVVPFKHTQNQDREKKQKQTISSVVPEPVERLLDFGCNTGRLTDFLANFAEEIYGADIRGWYGKKLKEVCPRAEYGLIENNNLPFKDDFFDIVFSCKVLQHLDVNTVVNVGHEIRRVLKKGGRLILYEGVLPDQKYMYDLIPMNNISSEIIKEKEDNYGLIVFRK